MGVENQFYRSNEHTSLAGVCGGLGEYCHVDPCWFRAGFIILTLFMPVLGIFAYLALWVFSRKRPADLAVPERGFTVLSRSRLNGKLAGVCGGLGSYFDIDPVVLRVIFVCGVFVSGLTLFAYIVFWMILPLDDQLVAD